MLRGVEVTENTIPMRIRNGFFSAICSDVKQCHEKFFLEKSRVNFFFFGCFGKNIISVWLHYNQLKILFSSLTKDTEKKTYFIGVRSSFFE